MLLVFPINNKKEPSSLWYEFFPRTEMRWEWDENGDSRVSDLWHLRERLSTSGKVVYTKWFRGRATVVSFELFAAMLKIFGAYEIARGGLSFKAREILDLLEEDSPISTKQLKRAAELTGKENEKYYNAATKELFSRGLIVGFGEVDEGAFPSLAVGATRILFEDQWNAGEALTEKEAWKTIDLYLPNGSSFRKYVDAVVKVRQPVVEEEL